MDYYINRDGSYEVLIKTRRGRTPLVIASRSIGSPWKKEKKPRGWTDRFDDYTGGEYRVPTDEEVAAIVLGMI